MVKITQGMKLNASMVKTILEGMFNSKVETGWSFSGKNVDMLVYIYNKNNKYDYEKYELKYVDDDSKDDADYCSILVNQMLNGICDVHQSSCEERYIQDILEETEVSKLFILDGRLCDSGNEISVDLSSINRIDYDKSGANIVLQEDDGYMYQVDMVSEYIRAIGEE